MDKFFVIGDIHGEWEKLQALMRILMLHEGFDPRVHRHHHLVSLGDKCDRGPDSFQVFDYFYQLAKDVPDQVHMLMGNHELMMIDAAKAGDLDAQFSGMYPNPYESPRQKIDLFHMNGGMATQNSYFDHVPLFNEHNVRMRTIFWFKKALEKCGHWDFLKSHMLFLETEDYFFSHAPLPNLHPLPLGWETDIELLTWTYEGEHTAEWVNQNVNGKVAAHGHIHGLRYNPRTGKCAVQQVRRHGNTFLVDTGCGCAANAPLSCLILPTQKVYNSSGEIYQL